MPSSLLSRLFVRLFAWALVVLGLGTALAAAAQPSGRRVALVIGNAAYADAPLKNPVNDAEDIAAALRGLGFNVTQLSNRNRSQFTAAIRDFGRNAAGAEAALFYYAGHGVQVRGRNFLLPVGQRFVEEGEVETDGVEVNSVLARLEDAGAKVSLIILDACRSNPLQRSGRGAVRGLARMEAPSGALVAFAAQPGAEAQDGNGRNGVFTQHLLQHIGTPGASVEQVFKRVRADVERDTARRQSPREESSLTADFYFVSPFGRTSPAEQQRLEDEGWARCRGAGNAAPCDDYLAAWPQGRFTAQARTRQRELTTPAPQANAGRKRVAIARFLGDSPWADTVGEIVAADLARSPLLKVSRLTHGGQPDKSLLAADVRAEADGADFIAVGEVRTLPDGRIDVRVRMFSASADLNGAAAAAATDDMRLLAHRAADDLHQRALGRIGGYALRRVLVNMENGRHQLFITDSDGEGRQIALRSPKAVGLPTWSRDQKAIGYVSWELGEPALYLQDLKTGKREKAADSSAVLAACRRELAAIEQGAPALLGDDWQGADCRPAIEQRLAAMP